MMRKFMFCCLLVLATVLQAAPISGISIESSRMPIVVYVDGSQVCHPTFSCFVANLARGTYRIEVYAAERSDYQSRSRSRALYSERVYVSGREVKTIVMNDREGASIGERDPITTVRDREPRYSRVMSAGTFSDFFAKVKNRSFTDDRLKMVEMAVSSSYFTSDQCLRLTELFSFDSEKVKLMKLMYPSVADKGRFYIVVDKLTFSSDRNKVMDFVKNYRE